MAGLPRALPAREPTLLDWARRMFNTFGPFVSIGFFLIAWETASRLGLVIEFLLPPLSVVLTRIGVDLISGTLLIDIGITLYRTLVAFALAVVIGVTLGILIPRVNSVRWFFDPIVSIALPMPKIALLPIFMLWFGLFDMSKILMVAFSASFQIIIATWSGTQNVERELIWSARSLGASNTQILLKVRIPASLPYVMAAAKTSPRSSACVDRLGGMSMNSQPRGGPSAR